MNYASNFKGKIQERSSYNKTSDKNHKTKGEVQLKEEEVEGGTTITRSNVIYVKRLVLLQPIAILVSTKNSVEIRKIKTYRGITTQMSMLLN